MHTHHRARSGPCSRRAPWATCRAEDDGPSRRALQRGADSVQVCDRRQSSDSGRMAGASGASRRPRLRSCPALKVPPQNWARTGDLGVECRTLVHGSFTPSLKARKSASVMSAWHRPCVVSASPPRGSTFRRPHCGSRRNALRSPPGARWRRGRGTGGRGGACESRRHPASESSARRLCAEDCPSLAQLTDGRLCIHERTRGPFSNRSRVSTGP